MSLKMTLASAALFALLTGHAHAQEYKGSLTDDEISVEEALDRQVEDELVKEAEVSIRTAMVQVKEDCRAQGREAFNRCCDRTPRRCEDDREFQGCHRHGNEVEAACKERVKNQIRENNRRLWLNFQEWFRKFLEELRRQFSY